MWSIEKILKILTQKCLEQKNDRLIMQSKKSKFIKEQEANGLLSNLGIKISLIKISLLNVLFECNLIEFVSKRH